MDKSFDRVEIKQTYFVRSNVIAKCSLVRVFLKVVPGSVQHNTAVHSVTKVPIISGKELKSVKNDLQFRSPGIHIHFFSSRQPGKYSKKHACPGKILVALSKVENYREKKATEWLHVKKPLCFFINIV